MANRTLDTTIDQTQVTATAVPATHQSAPQKLLPGLGRGVERDTAVLQRVTDGRLARAGDTLLQLQRSHGNHHIQRMVTQSQHHKGLPDNLKTGIEQLSGLSLDDVTVHYNSAKPIAVQALAYTQGTDIHIAPEQEQHLPHEAWHVVQQKQGRVQANMQIKGTAVNDNPVLEQEASVMGAKAIQSPRSRQEPSTNRGLPSTNPPPVVQRVVYANMNALLAAVVGLGGIAPNIAAFDPALQALYADAENQLPITDVVATLGLGRSAEAGVNPAPPPPYRLEYDPAWPDQNFLLSSILHELIHVSTNINYRKGGIAYPWLNLNLPPGLAGPAIGAELRAQQFILDQNLQDAVAVVNVDAALPAPVRNHVLDRLNNYAMPMPDVHYDTVLADIMAYLELNNINAGPTFNFIRRLVRESSNRRLVAPWWGTKRARRVNRNAAWWQIGAW